MFKKKTLIGIFAWIVSINSLQAIMDSQSAIFYNCDAEIIRNVDSLQQIFAYIINQLDQQRAGSISINHTEAGYTLLQALQKGGYLNVSVSNKENITYINWLIQKSTTQRKSLSTLLKKIQKVFSSSSYINK